MFRRRFQPLFDAPADAGTGGSAPITVDPAALDAAVQRHLANLANQNQPTPAGSGGQGGERSGAPDLNPTPGAPEGGASRTQVTPTGAVVDANGIVTDPAARNQLGRLMHRLFAGQATRNHQAIADAMDDLARAGFYGAEARERVEGGSRAMSTLTEGDGGVFLPEVVLNEVLRIVPNYGVIRRLARVINIDGGSIRIPNLTSGLAAFWIGEGAMIKARKAAFGKVTLDPEKMGIIVPWTTELREEAGGAFLDLVVQLIAEAFGYLEDRTALYGTGNSAFGGITGLASASGVGVHTLAVASTFASITRADLIATMKKVAPAVRRIGTWVFHPDTELTLSSLVDSQGRPIYLDDYRAGSTGPTLLGRPVEYVEAADAESATGASKVFGFFGDFQKLLFAQGRGMTSKLLTEATIKDVDDETDIYLGAQDMEALRVTQRLDILVADGASFARMRTGAAS